MRKIEKITAVLLTAAFLVTFVSCGSTTETESASVKETSESTPVSCLSEREGNAAGASFSDDPSERGSTPLTETGSKTLTEESFTSYTEPTAVSGENSMSSTTEFPTEETSYTEPTAVSGENSVSSTTEFPTEETSYTDPSNDIGKEDRDFLDQFTLYNYALTGEEKPYYLGRWFEKEGCMATFTSGSTLWFLIDGAEYFDVPVLITTVDEPYVSVMIDEGESFRRAAGDLHITLPDSGRHLVQLMADGFDYREDRYYNELGLYIREIVPANGGRLRGAKPENKVIFFYGDSITEGNCMFSPNSRCEYNSAQCCYPYICSSKLGCVPYYIGYCGTGVLSEDNVQPFRTMIDNVSSTRKLEEDIVPDLIVVNHGTNDNGVPAKTFESELRKALDCLRSRYPGVPVVLMIPLRQTQAKEIRRIAGNYENMYIVETDGWNISKNDHLHPNKAGAEKMGMLLSSELVRIFGNDFFDE